MDSTFKYILIPSNESLPIQELEGDTSGGLSDDYLAKTSKEYFFNQNGGKERAIALDNATPEQKKQLADKVRQQYGGKSDSASQQLNAMDDDALISMIRASEGSTTCEIIALTVPTPINNYRAVSMYADDNARNRNLPYNKRASALMKACGHAKSSSSSGDDGTGGVAGDVFIGRCHDNEAQDVWTRVDFTKEDAEGDVDSLDWCKVARSKGGGGGFGSGGAASLSGMMSSALGGGNSSSTSQLTDAVPDTEQTTADGYNWSQTEDEVELKFFVKPNTRSRDIKIQFKSKALSVSVLGESICNGETFGNVILDDCTYTIQDVAGKDERELCVILGKKTPEKWSWPVKSMK